MDEYIPKISDVLEQSDKTLTRIMRAKIEEEQEKALAPVKKDLPAERSSDGQIATTQDLPPDVQQFEDDFSDARQNLRKLIANGNTTLTGLLALAASDQNPRTYEVAVQLFNSLSQMNQDTLTIHEKRKKLKDSQPELPQGTNITNNNLFVGSTEDMLDELDRIEKRKARREKNNIIDHDDT